jgi:hypothetical protein
MFVPIFACIFGCGVQVSVAIDAHAAPNAKAETHFVVAASDPHVRADNPDFILIRKAVARALVSQGYQTAKSETDADLVVVIDWMVSDPKIVVRHAGGDAGRPQVTGAAPGGKNGMPLAGSSNYGALGFGTEAQDRQELSYQRTLTLKGVDRRAFDGLPTAKPLWDMTLTSEGDTDSVDMFAPQMVAAAIPYIASDAGKVRSRLGSAEAPVKYVRGEIAALPIQKPQP